MGEVKEEIVEVKEPEKGKKTKKKGSKILKIIIIVIVSLLLCAGIYYALVTFVFKSSSNYPILFENNEQLVLWKNSNEKNIVVEEEFKDENLKMAYGKTNHNLMAYIVGDVLYLYDAGNGNKIRLASNMEDGEYIKFISNDKYLIFEDDSDNIYLYEIKTKDKTKIAGVKDDGETSAVRVIDDFLLYYEYIPVKEDSDDYQYNYYLYNVKTKNKKKIANVKEMLVSDDENRLLYTSGEDNKKYSAYIYDIKKDETSKIIADAESLYNADKDYKSFIYSQPSATKLVVDDEGKDVKNIRHERTEICDDDLYFSGNCDFDEWWDEEEVTVVDEIDKKRVNEEIMEYAEDIELVDLYSFKDGKSSLIAKDVITIETADASSSKAIYWKTKEAKTFKTSSYESSDKFIDDFKDYINKNIDIYYYDGSKEILLNLDTEDHKYEPDDGIDAVFSNNETYVLIDGELSKLTVEGDKTKLDLIDNNVYSIAMETKYGVLYSVENKKNDYYTIKIIKDGKTEDLGENVMYIPTIGEDGLYFYEDCANYSCSYSKYNGSKKTILTDVSYVIEVDDKNIYIFKNYSDSTEKCDLYKYDGKNTIQIAFDVGLSKNSILYIND